MDLPITKPMQRPPDHGNPPYIKVVYQDCLLDCTLNVSKKNSKDLTGALEKMIHFVFLGWGTIYFGGPTSTTVQVIDFRFTSKSFNLPRNYKLFDHCSHKNIILH